MSLINKVDAIISNNIDLDDIGYFKNPIEYESDGRQFKMRSGGTKGLGTDSEIVYPEEDNSGAEGAQ